MKVNEKNSKYLILIYNEFPKIFFLYLKKGIEYLTKINQIN